MEHEQFPQSGKRASNVNAVNRSEQSTEEQRDLLYKTFDEARAWRIVSDPLSLEPVAATSETAKSENVRNMTELMKNQRSQWMQTRQTYRSHHSIVITSAEHLLQHRVLPPLLDDFDVSKCSSKSDNRKRKYPPPDVTKPWTEFDDRVRDFKPVTDSKTLADLWHTSGQDSADAHLENEESEKYWLQFFVMHPLQKAGLCRYKKKVKVQQKCNPDFLLFGSNEDGSNDRIVLTAEFKATHNLRLPETAENVVEVYQAAHKQESKNSKGWIFVVHPLGQAARVMIENKVAYGALTSSSRTHFLRLEQDNKSGAVSLLITRRWYVGEHNYLRAWSYIANLAAKHEQSEIEKLVEAVTWEEMSTPTFSPDRKRRKFEPEGEREKDDQDGGKGSGKNVVQAMWNELEFTGTVLGTGRHGEVQEAVWGGSKVAVKMFNVDKGYGECFDAELRTYTALKDVQGVLIPRLHFWATSTTGALLALGLQRGWSEPRCESGNMQSSPGEVVKKLREHGYEHGDSDNPYNFIYVDDGEGGERLVAIDLEWAERIARDSPSAARQAMLC